MESSEAVSMHQLPSPAKSKSSAGKKKLGVSSALGRLYRGLNTWCSSAYLLVRAGAGKLVRASRFSQACVLRERLQEGHSISMMMNFLAKLFVVHGMKYHDLNLH